MKQSMCWCSVVKPLSHRWFRRLWVQIPAAPGSQCWALEQGLKPDQHCGLTVPGSMVPALVTVHGGFISCCLVPSKPPNHCLSSHLYPKPSDVVSLWFWFVVVARFRPHGQNWYWFWYSGCIRRAHVHVENEYFNSIVLLWICHPSESAVILSAQWWCIQAVCFL